MVFNSSQHHHSSSLLLARLLLTALQNFLTASLLQQLGVNALRGKLDITNNGAANEAVFHRKHVGVALHVGDCDVGQLDVQVLINGVKDADDAGIESKIKEIFMLFVIEKRTILLPQTDYFFLLQICFSTL